MRRSSMKLFALCIVGLSFVHSVQAVRAAVEQSKMIKKLKEKYERDWNAQNGGQPSLETISRGLDGLDATDGSNTSLDVTSLDVTSLDVTSLDVTSLVKEAKRLKRKAQSFRQSVISRCVGAVGSCLSGGGRQSKNNEIRSDTSKKEGIELVVRELKELHKLVSDNEDELLKVPDSAPNKTDDDGEDKTDSRGATKKKKSKDKGFVYRVRAAFGQLTEEEKKEKKQEERRKRQRQKLERVWLSLRDAVAALREAASACYGLAKFENED